MTTRRSDKTKKAGTVPPFLSNRISLPALMRDVKQDRTSAAFAMEKLDQAAINLLFINGQENHASRPSK